LGAGCRQRSTRRDVSMMPPNTRQRSVRTGAATALPRRADVAATSRSGAI